ncbi:MAG: hypothetical protein M1830_001350 [Pleopsidium flavum]|nr:MAG: hypothetical protein M1830_001350 [Pleopsidium flavum]
MSRRPALEEVVPDALNSRLSSPGNTARRILTPRTRRFASDVTPSNNSLEEDPGSASGPMGRHRFSSPSPPPMSPQDAALSSIDLTPEQEDPMIDHFKPIFQMGFQPSKLQLTFNCPPGQQGPFIVNLDLGSLLGIAAAQTSSSMGTVKPPYQQFASSNDFPGTIMGKGFASLPPELRNRVYRLLLVRNKPVQFQVKRNNSRTAVFLRTSRQIYQEGRSILYGENQFVFSRVSDRTGAWFVPSRKEIGYTDMERFFRAIGPYNTSMLKNITINLSDALSPVTPELDPEDRRFVNDESLQRVLKIMGKHSKLKTIRLDFGGKRMVMRADTEFLDALTSFMAENVEIEGKIDAKIEKEVLLFMEYPGPLEPTLRSWNKGWQPRFGGRCR